MKYDDVIAAGERFPGIAALWNEATVEKRRPRPDNPQWKIPPSEWQTVLYRIDQGESLRTVAGDYGVSYEAIRRVVRAARRF